MTIQHPTRELPAVRQVRPPRMRRMATPGAAATLDHRRPARPVLFEAIPCWMASAVVHLAAILVLALLYFPAPVGVASAVITLTPAAAPEELEELELPEELDPVDEMTLSVTPVMQLESRLLERVTEIDLASESPAAAVRVELADLSQPPVPVGDLLFEVGTLAGEALTGRGERARGQLVSKYGGTQGSERAVAMALKWFAEHQRRDGSWSLDHRDGPCDGRCSQPGAMQDCFTGGTALALLPFLGAGQTHEEGKYQQQVEAGLRYLVKVQDRRRGALVSGGGSMYSHGLAAIALSEAYAMTRDRHLEEPAQAALRYIVYAQDPAGGGWRYFPHQPGDTSVVGWQLMALKSGHMGRLKVPRQAILRVSKFLDAVQVDGGAFYGYTGPSIDKPSNTAAGLLCRMYLGWERQNQALERGVRFLSERGPAASEEHTRFHMYYNYYATQVLRHYGGELWLQWNESMRELLVGSQRLEGHAAGSWDIPDWELAPAHDTENGGRLYYTSLATMILEVYYRYLPIYGEAAAEDFPL